MPSRLFSPSLLKPPVPCPNCRWFLTGIRLPTNGDTVSQASQLLPCNCTVELRWLDALRCEMLDRQVHQPPRPVELSHWHAPRLAYWAYELLAAYKAIQQLTAAEATQSRNLWRRGRQVPGLGPKDLPALSQSIQQALTLRSAVELRVLLAAGHLMAWSQEPFLKACLPPLALKIWPERHSAAPPAPGQSRLEKLDTHALELAGLHAGWADPENAALAAHAALKAFLNSYQPLPVQAHQLVVLAEPACRWFLPVEPAEGGPAVAADPPAAPPAEPPPPRLSLAEQLAQRRRLRRVIRPVLPDDDG